MSKSLTALPKLVQRHLLSADDANHLTAVAEKYSVSITETMADIIDLEDVSDPIRAQFIPRKEELNLAQNELDDPISDSSYSPMKGLVHRYPDRILIKPIHSCAVYCRFCFRREQVGRNKEALNAQDLTNIYAYIQTHPEIWEVIFTGGDPLLLSPRKLAEILTVLGTIDHVKVIRFHTRIPLVSPDFINDDMISALKSCNKTIWISLHSNHVNEFTPDGEKAIASIIDAGIPMVSQTVLLKDINDKVETLDALFRHLVQHRIKPYYLHHPDLANGTKHFRLPIRKGQTIYKALLKKLSGIARPHYCLDIPNGAGKIPIHESYATQDRGQPDKWVLSDANGNLHDYVESYNED